MSENSLEVIGFDPLLYKVPPASEGPRGVGVSTLGQDSNGHLIVTLTDGSTFDAGPMRGQSAYDTAVANGYVGSQTEWIASLEGPKGAPGADALLANPLRRQHARSQRLGPVTTDITSVTDNGTLDSTLTRAHNAPVTGLTSGQARVLTPAEQAAMPYDLGQGINHSVYLSGTVGYVLPYTKSNNIDLGTKGYWPSIWGRTIRFMTDAPKLDIAVAAMSFNTAVESYQIFVDGVPVTLTPQRLSVWATYLHIQFPSVKTRLVEIRTDLAIATIYCRPQSHIWRPNKQEGPRVLVVGDSYVAPIVWDNSSGANQNNMFGAFQQLEDWLDVEDVWVEGISSTGFVTKATTGFGGPNNSFADRVSGHVAAAPDMLVTCTGFPADLAAGVSVSTIVDAVDTYLTTLRTALPSCKFVILNGFRSTVFGDYSTQLGQIISGLQAKRSDVYYIDSLSMLDLAGYVGATTGTGNSDIYLGNDGVHPTVLGHAYLRARLAPILHRILADNDGALINTLLS